MCSINLRRECSRSVPAVSLLTVLQLCRLPPPGKETGVCHLTVREPLLTASHKMKLRLLSLTNETSPDHPCALYSLAPCRPALLSPPASRSLPVPAHLGPPAGAARTPGPAPPQLPPASSRGAPWCRPHGEACRTRQGGGPSPSALQLRYKSARF